jgi:D-threo-aldose 1-dehydrogenase
MSFDPAERRAVGSTGLEVTRLSFGGASIGGLFRPVDEGDAIRVIRHAWDLGIRSFDTAPLYGYGASERRMGRALADRARHDFVLSTKVGRLVYAADATPPNTEIDRQAIAGREDAFYHRAEPVRLVFDYSSDGVLRSIEASLLRLGLERIDIALIHDPDAHWEAAIEGAYPALDRLRRDGVVGAIGVGMNQAPMLARFARETDIDVVLMANRYTLLNQEALDELLPLCVQRGIAVLIGGVMNSGILVNPSSAGRFDYVQAPPDVVARAQRLAAVCARHGVDLRAAAIQFPLAHPAVASLVAGVRSIEHLDEYPRAMAMDLPAGLWAELRDEGLLHPEAPVPS